MSYNIKLCYVVLSYVTLRYASLCYAMLVTLCCCIHKSGRNLAPTWFRGKKNESNKAIYITDSSYIDLNNGLFLQLQFYFIRP